MPTKKNSHPSCFVEGFMDSEGQECPFHECVFYARCEEGYIAVEGLKGAKLKKALEKDKLKVLMNKKYQRRFLKEKSQYVDRLDRLGVQHTPHRKGYKKPHGLEWSHQGDPRDFIAEKVAAEIEGLYSKVKRTKFLHTFFQDDQILLKLELRRKNKVLLFVESGVAEELHKKGLYCRSLYDSERPNYPGHLTWVVELVADGHAELLREALEYNSDIS